VIRLIFAWVVTAIATGVAFGQSAEFGATTNLSPSTIPSMPEIPMARPPPTVSKLATSPTTVPSPVPESQPIPAAPEATGTSTLNKVVVTSPLENAQLQIAPALGGNTYTEGPQQIQSIPEGENAPFQQVLLRMPGVVEDSYGQEHVRGEHADVTYRLNGVILPEPLNGFGQELDTHLIQSVTLIDGALPAQFGFRTAGIVDVTTKSGASLQSNEISIYGGSYNTLEPSVELGGSTGKWDYFVTGTYKQDSIGIENPTSDRFALHDDTDQSRFFGYFDYHIDDTSRINLLVNTSYGNFQIPNTAGLSPQFALAGAGASSSEDINENQNEQQYYTVLSYLKSEGDFSIQASGYASYGQIHFSPDTTGDLIYQGVAGDVFNNYIVEGVQVDSSYKLNDDHTLRFGGIGDYTVERDDTSTWVFGVDPATGNPTSDVPFNIDDNTRNHATSAGVYAQDEWKLTKNLTLNYGARFDEFDANFDNEGQLSPRASLVWEINKSTTAHVGYSRYFDPPPVQYVPPTTIAKFVNTTNAAPNMIDDPPKVEKSNYYDAGVSRYITDPWLVSLDGYFKQAHNLVDLGQFGDAVILSPFNYQEGFDYGVEASSTYKAHGVSAFGNFAWVETGGKDIDSQEFLIDNAELAYIQSRFIKLDHDSTFTASAGVSDDITPDDLIYSDITYGSGLRAGFANVLQEPYYYPVNVGYQHIFHTDMDGRDLVKLRFDIINLFDQSYQLRAGSGIGVAAPQYGQRREFLMGISYDF